MGLESIHQGVYQFAMLIAATVASIFGTYNEVPIATLPQAPTITQQKAQTFEITQPEVLAQESLPVYGPNLEDIPLPESLAQEAAEAEPTSAPSPTAKPTPTPKPTPKASVQTVITTPKPTLAPTPTIKPTSTPTQKPTPKPTITATLQPASPSAKITAEIVIPTPKPIAPQKSLNTDTILQLINNKRSESNLVALEKDDRLCKIANYRGPQLYEEIFETGKLHQGLYDLNLPYWVTENMAHYPSESLIVQWWMNSTLHRRAILGNYKYTCGVCVGNSCAQLFSSFVLK